MDVQKDDSEDGNVQLQCKTGLNEPRNSHLIMHLWSRSCFIPCEFTATQGKCPTSQTYGNGICVVHIIVDAHIDQQYCCAVKNNDTQEFVISCKNFEISGSPENNEQSSTIVAAVLSPLAFIILVVIIALIACYIIRRRRIHPLGRDQPIMQGT